MLSNVTCPNCKHKYWLDEGAMGSKQTCPSCKAEFFAGASVAMAGSPALAAASAASAASQSGYSKTMIGDTAPSIKYNCPRCKTPLEGEPGTKKNCPNCTQRHQVPAAAKPEPAAAAAPGLNKTMLVGDENAAPPRPPIKYNCPNCKKPLEAPPEQGGTKTNCPACQQRLQIPAAPPAALNRNKTMLAADENSAPVSAAPSGSVVESARGVLPTAAGPTPAANPWATLLTPKNVALGILVLLLLLLVVPAVFRGGKSVDNEALAKAQMELERLKADIEMKKREMEIRANAETAARQKIDEFIRESRREEEKRREEDRRRVDAIQDADRRSAEQRRIRQEQEQRETARLENEKRQRQLLEESRQQLADAKKALESSQQKQQTIIQQAPPAVYYPPYHWRFYAPWW